MTGVNERIVISGANGWMGREIIYRLLKDDPHASILALGRRNSRLTFQCNGSVPVHEWTSTDVAAWQPTAFVHLAALTTVQLNQMSNESHTAENRSLMRSALAISQLPSVRSVVIASSGAALTQLDNPYGIHKAFEEIEFQKALSSWGKTLVIARIWSVSGRFCTKSDQLLFFDLLHQVAAGENPVRIRANKKVYRTYVDAGEFLEICLKTSLSGHSGVIDSTGMLVEAAELAQLIQMELKVFSEVRRAPILHSPDIYYSQSRELENWSRITGVGLSDLNDQVARCVEIIDPSSDSECATN